MVVAVLIAVAATLVWSAEQAPAPAAPATPPAPGAQGQPAGEQPKAEAAPAPGPATVAPATPAPAGAEAPPAAEKVKGWILAVKMGDGATAMRDLTLKVAGNKMRAEGMGWGTEVYLVDADAKATYIVTVRHSPGSPTEEASQQFAVEKYSWAAMDRMWRATVDDSVMTQHMRSRNLEDPKDRDAAEALAKALEAQKKPATIEATEETKKFGDYDCVKYNLTQGDKVKGAVWVAKDLKTDSPVWAMVGHLLERSIGGLPVLVQVDGIKKDGFAIRVNLEYPASDMGHLYDHKLNFWIDKVTQADIDATDVQIPHGAQASEAMHP